MDEIVSRILIEMKKCGYDQKTFAKELEISPQIITDWKKGKTNSYTRYIQKISDMLKVSSDYLLTGVEPPAVPQHDPQTLAALAKFEQLSVEDRAKVLGYIEGLISSRL